MKEHFILIVESILEGGLSLLSKSIRKEIKSLGWTELTGIQKLSIPSILDGENVLLIAPTGTGKTEAAVFPLFDAFLHERSRIKLAGVSILYITPLRALNRDILRRLVEIGGHLDISVEIRHGDTPESERRRQALNPPEMLITTPETLQAILPARKMGKNLRNVRWVIVDEIHELATDKRGVQLALGLERLREITEREFQRIGLSATVGNPELIGRFLVGAQRSIKVLKAIDSKDFSITVESPSSTVEDEKIADQVMLSTESVAWIRRLFQIIRENTSTLIFTNTREHAEALASRMSALSKDGRIGVHHGSLSKEVRMETESKLKSGDLKGVISTSSLELGIDVGLIEFVVQYMSPRQVTRLVQRIGRSGHVTGATSRGCILAGIPDDVLEAAVIARFALEERLEDPVFHDRALDVLAHQVVGLILTHGRMELEKLFAIARRAYPYRDISAQEFEEAVTQLAKQGTVSFVEGVVRSKYQRSRLYYYSNLSVIADVKKYNVVDYSRKRRVGTLDQEFVARNGTPGLEFVIHGQTWRVLSVDEENLEIQVEPVQQSLAAVPSWEGELIPVPFDVAQEVGKIRRLIAERVHAQTGGPDPLGEYPTDEESAEKVHRMVLEQISKGLPVPTDKNIVIEAYRNYMLIHSCFGSLVNETLARLLAALLSSRTGLNVGTQADPYRIALITPVGLRLSDVKREIEQLMPNDVEPLLKALLKETNLFAWRLWQVGKRFGAVTEDTDYRSFRAKMLAKALEETPIFTETMREIHVEKLDVARTEKVLRMIMEGDIMIEISPPSEGFSQFAIPLLDKIAPHDVLRPAEPIHEIIEIVKERIGSKFLKFVCIFNADYEGVRRINDLPEKISCPKCNSTLMAVTYMGDRELKRVADKRIARKKLSLEEEGVWQRGWRSASLVQNYGKKAAITMAAYGVGPHTATRILRRIHVDEDEFYMDIVRAERDYVRTRAFWND